jgi:hypothetical protein
MANIDYKHAAYTIAANTTPPPFTFWWGRDSKAPNEFFDVSIAPHENKNHPNMQALQIVGKAVEWDPRGGVGVVMLLTVHNPNDFPVTFEANHVRIYS